MPLFQTKYGGECPLGKFKIDMASPGSYTADPVEACFVCNFADNSVEKFDLEQICQCPVDMTWNEYNRLKKDFLATEKDGKRLTKKDFWEFVRENYRH